MQLIKSIFAVAAATLVAGCAQDPIHKQAKDQVGAYADRFKEERAVASTVTESDTPTCVRILSSIVRRCAVAFLSTSLACHCVWRWQPLRKSGYSVSFVGRADPNRPVTLSLNNMDFENAAKEIAFTAGYVAVLDRASRQINIAEEATYTFKLDPESLEARTDNYSTSSVPGTSGGSGSGSSSGSGSGSGSLVVPVVQVARRARPPVRW
jgi:uncharacterized membrane protein YgcG